MVTTMGYLEEMFVASFPETAVTFVFCFVSLMFVSAIVSAGIIVMFTRTPSRPAWDI
jgi:hypothetical protein